MVLCREATSLPFPCLPFAFLQLQPSPTTRIPCRILHHLFTHPLLPFFLHPTTQQAELNPQDTRYKRERERDLAHRYLPKVRQRQLRISCRLEPTRSDEYIFSARHVTVTSRHAVFFSCFNRPTFPFAYLTTTTRTTWAPAGLPSPLQSGSWGRQRRGEERCTPHAGCERGNSSFPLCILPFALDVCRHRHPTRDPVRLRGIHSYPSIHRAKRTHQTCRRTSTHPRAGKRPSVKHSLVLPTLHLQPARHSIASMMNV